MSYLKSWRKYHAEVDLIAQSTSDSSDDQEGVSVLCEETVDNSMKTGNVDSDRDVPNVQFHNEDDCISSLSDSYSEDHSISSLSGSSDSDGEELDGDESAVEEASFSEDLAAWATRHKCTRSAIKEMLAILKKQGHRLPKDSRTLLQTPRFIEIVEKCGGQYLYLGIESGLLKLTAQYPVSFKDSKEIPLNINIDGVPLFRSSNAQLWPILCSIQKFEPFVVAVFYGKPKPNSVEEYLSDFLTELITLAETGISVGEDVVRVKVNAFICDAPARSFIKCTKGHNAYFACERCVVKGTWHGRVVFDTGNDIPSLRNDADFMNLKYQNHQLKRSPLIDARLPCVSTFALDYMNLVCLGVVKRILMYLRQGPRDCKFSQHHLSLMSERLCSLNGKLPREFARQPRSLNEMDKWKATDFRQFVLYTGPLVLQSVVPERVYHHFLTLTVVLSILLDSKETSRNEYVGYARELMTYFVKTGPEIHGETFTSYNVHSLVL